MEPLISVIVPVYKVEEYLSKCVDSILNQTYKNLEIILVDDGSPDRCGEICDVYAEKDKRVSVVHQRNSGVASARNTGLEVIHGEYLMFVDSDDFLHGDAVRILYERLAIDNSDMAVGNAVCVDESGAYLMDLYTSVKNSVKTRDEILQEVGGPNSVPCYAWGKLYRSKLFDTLRFAEQKYAEDVWIFIDILMKCTNVTLVSDILYYYVQRQSSLIHTLTDDKIMDSISAALYAACLLRKYGMTVASKRYITSAVYQAMSLHDVRAARMEIHKVASVFDIRHDVHTIFRWMVLYFPVLHRILRRKFEK